MKKEEKGTTVTGEVVEMRDKTETGKKETGEDTRIEEIDTERVRPEEEAVPGSLEEEDLAPKDQEEANPEAERKSPRTKRTIKRTKKPVKERVLHLPEVPDGGP